MKKVGILTFHYSNNFGGVLQCYALQSFLKSKGYEVETINYIPISARNQSILHSTGIRKNIFKSEKVDLMPVTLIKRIIIKAKYNKKITVKFDKFREAYMSLSKEVNENTISTILSKYDSIIVGSDQVWNPGRRNQKHYFLDFGGSFKGKKISYAADSTISEVNSTQVGVLSEALQEFHKISVRNDHSNLFVKNLIGNYTPVVCDPTLLVNFSELKNKRKQRFNLDEKFILVYALGKEIDGSNKRLINKIKEKYGDLKVYSIVIPTMKFNIPNYANKVLYDLDPIEWLELFRKATFIMTDSFHGTLFSLKFHKPFIAYYTETLRSTRFIDLGKRYEIEDFIVSTIEDVDMKNSLYKTPDYNRVDNLIHEQKEVSMAFLENALKDN